MLTRREGIKAAALTALSYSRVLRANDRIRLGLIGCGERGLYVASLFQKNAEVDLRAVCDVFGDRTDKALAQAAGAQTFGDHRKLLEVDGLDDGSEESQSCRVAPCYLPKATLWIGKELDTETIEFKRHYGQSAVHLASVTNRGWRPKALS